MKINFTKLFFVALFLLCTTIVKAYDFYSYPYYYKKTSSSTLEIVDAKLDSGRSLNIPGYIIFGGTTYAVTSIAKNAFRENGHKTEISISSTIKKIGANAFSYCDFTTVYIKDIASWLEIEFENSGSNPLSSAEEIYVDNQLIHELVLPDGLMKIPNYSLCSFKGLTSVVIPNSVTSIGEAAFNNCTGLTSVVIPNSVTSIGEAAFNNCTGLTNIEISNSVTNIGNSAFGGCENLKEVYISDLSAWCNISFGSSYANPLYYAGILYLNGEKVTNLVIPNSVTNIGDYAFNGCTGLTNIEIPNSVTSIGYYAFNGCTGLTSIIVPSCVTEINDQAFQNCVGLTTAIIASSQTIIGENSFKGCNNLNDIFVCSPIPPTMVGDELAFGNMSKMTLYIPYGSASKYKASSQWGSFANYVEFNNPNNLSHKPVTLYICDFIGDILRWESSRDGGNTWTNLDCRELYYTENNPERGEVLYRALNTNGAYSDILTINYYDAVPKNVAIAPASETKTVDESVTFTLDVLDDGYTYQWMHNDNAIEGATKNTYSISAIKMKDAGKYYCVVSNPVSSVNSSISTIVVNKCPQVITFPEIETRTYGDESFTLPATTDKGLTINYQSTNSNVATIDGNIVTIKEPGETNIIATQLGNDDYLEASYVSRKLIVKKKAQTIVFDELQDRTYEDLPFTLPATTDKGLSISYQSTNTNVATIEGNKVTIVGAGTTDIIANQQGDEHHYATTPVSRTLTVNRQTQSITFNAFGNVVYGDAQIELNQYTNKNFEITYTSSNTDVATVDGNIISVIKPGVTVIKAIQNGNKNYLPAQSIERTLIVNKAEQKIEWHELPAKKYGDDDFALPKTTDKGLTISYTSDNEDVATINGNIVSIKNAGSTNITATQSGDDYYNAATAVTQILTVSKITQSITFEELPVMTFGDTPIELNATASSSNEVVFESSDETVATISGKTLTVVGAGSCIITASCAGDNNYYTATPVERTLIVNKAEQTITIAPVNGKTYGDEPFELNVTTNNNRPLVLTSSDASVLSIKGTTATIRGAGNVTITALQEATDEYEKAETQISIVVGKAILTASVSNAERVYGEENPNFDITYSGFVNDETKEDLDMIPVVTCRATRYSNVGEYDITISSITDKNYVLDAKEAKLVIKKALLTVTPNDVTKVYGEKNPTLRVTYSGFKNNENETVLLSKAVAFTKVKTMSNAGEYAITAEGANAVNYEFEYEESVFTVEKAPLVITAEDKNINYMDEIPMFTILYDGFVGNDSEADLDELPRISCDATNEAKPGTYEIVLSGGYDNNYEYTLINGTMVIIDTTGINAIDLDLEKNVVYDLNGLRITETENLTRGIYIINGKKVFVK